MSARFGPNDPPSVKAGKSGGDEIPTIAISSSGDVVATVSAYGPLRLFELPSLAKLGKPREHVAALAFSPDASVLATLAGRYLELRDPRTGEIRARTPASESPMSCVAFSPDNARIAVGEYHKVIVFDAKTVAEVSRFEAFDRVVSRVAWSYDGRFIAVQASSDVGVFDAATGKSVAVLSGVHTDKGLRGRGALAFLADGRLMATLDPTAIGVWNAGEGGEPAKKIPARSYAYAVATHPDLVAIGNVLVLEIYTRDLELIETIKLPDELFSLAISKDGNTIAGGSYQHLLAWRRGGVAVKAPAPKSSRIAKPRKPKTDDLAKIDWLGKVGKLSAWPGPDDEGVASLLDLIQSLENDVSVAFRALGKDTSQSVYNATFTRAVKNVPSYDPKADWSEPATAAPTMVATIAQLVANFRTLGWPLARDLETLLAVCADGKWPCALEAKRALRVI